MKKRELARRFAGRRAFAERAILFRAGSSWEPASDHRRQRRGRVAVESFGNGNPTGAFSYELRFPGQFFDQSTKLRYNYFRDYDPRTGRYIESDPIGLQGGIASSGFLSDIVPSASLAETGRLAPPPPVPLGALAWAQCALAPARLCSGAGRPEGIRRRTLW